MKQGRLTRGKLSRFFLRFMLAGLLQLGLVTGTDAQKPLLPHTTAELPGWVESRLAPDRSPRIAWIGINPDFSYLHLPSDSGFTVKPCEGCYPPSPADANLVAALRSGAPRLDLVISPLSDSDGDRPAALAEAITWAVRQDPDVLYIPYRLFSQDDTGSKALTKALAEAWARSVLPITVVDSSPADVPRGVFAVAIRSTSDPGCSSSSNELVNEYRHLYLPESVFSDGFGATRGTQAAAIYLALVAATLPSTGAFAHLERASILFYNLPSLMPEGEGTAPYLEFSPGLSQGGAISLGDRVYPWDARVVDVKHMVNLQGRYAEPDEVQRRIILGVNGQTRLRHLIAVGRLTSMISIFLFPSIRGILTFRTARTPTWAQRERILDLLRTLEGTDEDTLFYSVAPDAVLTRHR